jgi:serine/threonine protein kinase
MANFEDYDYPHLNFDEPNIPPLAGFHTHPQGLELVEDSQLAATITTTNNQVMVAHPTLNQVWRRDKRIGKGGAGLIFREYIHSGTANPNSRVVKKQVTAAGEAASTPDEIKNELSLLLLFSQSSGRPDLFTRCHGWFMEDSHLVIAMDLLHGDLDDHLYHTGQPFSEPDARVVVGQVLAALAFMHEKHVSHRDVKLNNIMIATKPTSDTPATPWSVRLGDFGTSQYHADPALAPDGRINTHGTPNYKAPELFFQVEPEEATLLLFEAKADMWALGVTVYRMLTGEAPYGVLPEDPDPSQVRKFCREGPPRRPLDKAGVSELARGFIRVLTRKSARERPTAAQALAQSRWVNGTV